MLGKTLLVALVLTHTLPTYGTEVRAVRAVIILRTVVLVGTLVLVGLSLVSDKDGGVSADKILVSELDNIGIKKDGRNLFLCLLRGIGIDGDGLVRVGGQGNVRLVQCIVLAFRFDFYNLGQGFRAAFSADNQRASLLSRALFCLEIPR